MTAPGAPHLALAEHWLQVGRPEDTLRELDRAGDAAVSRGGLALRGRAQLRLGHPEQAAECAGRGLSQAPDDIGLLGLLAAALGSLDDLEGAERALLAALRQAPDAVGLLVYYATLLRQAAQFDKAERVLDRAARTAPDSAAVLAERSDLALARGRRREARRWSQQALARDPDSSSARLAAGSVALRTGEMTQARRHLHSAAAADMSNTHLRTAARQAGYLAHPLMVPMRLVTRLGLPGTYLVGLVLVIGGSVIGTPVGGAAVMLWLVFVVYTWTVPRLLRAWLRRQGRL